MTTEEKSIAVDLVIDHYKTYHPKAKPGKAERDKIRKRLKDDKLLVSDLCDAIDGNHKDPHCCGNNDRGTKYHDLELIVRDSANVNKYRKFVIEDNSKVPESNVCTLEEARQLFQPGK